MPAGPVVVYWGRWCSLRRAFFVVGMVSDTVRAEAIVNPKHVGVDWDVIPHRRCDVGAFVR
jgi:hypothetical protein